MTSLSDGLQKITDNPVFSINLVGHGGEKFTPEMGSFGLEQYENDIMEKLPDGEVIIVGHSMGAVCGFNLAQRIPQKVRGVVMIDPTMCGGLADPRVAKALMSDPRRYILPIFTNGMFIPKRADAQMMLYNGQESVHLDNISQQPAAGRAIRQMLLGKLRTSSIRPVSLVIAGESRLSPERQKRTWAKNVHATDVVTLKESHNGVLENVQLPTIVANAIKRVSV